MRDQSEHAKFVDAWLQRMPGTLDAPQVIDLFDAALRALWESTHNVLGAITLEAVLHRVVYIATEKFPILSGLEVEVGGVRFQELRDRAPSSKREEVLEPMRFVLIEFLTTFDNLTAQILIPSLRAALSAVTPQSTHAAGAPKRGIGRSGGGKGAPS